MLHLVTIGSLAVDGIRKHKLMESFRLLGDVLAAIFSNTCGTNINHSSLCFGHVLAKCPE
jgi:hypothetical protein